MRRRRPHALALGIGAALASASLMSLPALAISVTLNGTEVTFSPPPIERAGRVFVPLRGVFERLGASVVYSGGVIDARGNNRSISLRIGSTTATIDGSPRPLDVAPFIVGASTYVPLRFVSEALGAGVNYDATNAIVALTKGGAPSGSAPTPAVTTNALKDLQPANGAYVGSTKPTISANFTAPVDPNSVKLSLDGLDITTATTRSTSGVVYAPPSPLQSIQHRVGATGRFANGQSFTQTWSFTTGSQAPRNSLVIASPANGATVSSSFTLAGRTLPNARIHIVAGATANVGGVFAFGAGNYTGDLTADSTGSFSQIVSLQTVSGAEIGLTITSTDPVSKESAEKRLRLRAQ